MHPGPGADGSGIAGHRGALADLVADTGDAARGRCELLQVRLYLAGARLADVERGADTADAWDVPGGDLIGEDALGLVAVPVQPVPGSGYGCARGYGIGYGLGYGISR